MIRAATEKQLHRSRNVIPRLHRPVDLLRMAPEESLGPHVTVIGYQHVRASAIEPAANALVSVGIYTHLFGSVCNRCPENIHFGRSEIIGSQFILIKRPGQGRFCNRTSRTRYRIVIPCFGKAFWTPDMIFGIIVPLSVAVPFKLLKNCRGEKIRGPLAVGLYFSVFHNCSWLSVCVWNPIFGITPGFITLVWYPQNKIITIHRLLNPTDIRLAQVALNGSNRAVSPVIWVPLPLPFNGRTISKASPRKIVLPFDWTSFRRTSCLVDNHGHAATGDPHLPGGFGTHCRYNPGFRHFRYRRDSCKFILVNQNAPGIWDINLHLFGTGALIEMVVVSPGPASAAKVPDRVPEVQLKLHSFSPEKRNRFSISSLSVPVEASKFPDCFIFTGE